MVAFSKADDKKHGRVTLRKDSGGVLHGITTADKKEIEKYKSQGYKVVDESLIVGLNKSSAEYKAGKEAAKKGIKYDANPHAPGVKRLNWSTGHNDFRADALRKAGKPNYGARGQFEDAQLTENRKYTVVHVDKGKAVVDATSSYEAAKKAAAKWGLKSTSGIDAHLMEEVQLDEMGPFQQVSKLLIKYGNNPKEVKRMMTKHMPYVTKQYPNASPAKVAEIISSLSATEEVELDEASYRGYEIKRQNNKYGHPLIVPALKLTGTNMKDIKQLIDRHFLFSIEKEQVDEGTWHIAKDMTKLKTAMKKPIPIGDMNWDFVAKYIGDDELWDDFQDLKTGQDMRPAIKKAMKRLGIREEVQLDEFTISDIQQMVKKGWVNKISPEKMKELQKINQKNNGNITRQDLLNLNIAHLGIAKEADLTKTQVKMVHDKADELPKQDFIKRYGKDGDAVRFATATNIVKKKLGIED